MRIQAADPPLTAVSVLQPTAAQAPPGCGTPPPAATAAGQAEGCTISRPTSGRQAGSETAAGQAAGSSQPVHKQGAGWESERAGQLLRAASHLHLHRQRLWTRMKSAGALPFCSAWPAPAPDSLACMRRATRSRRSDLLRVGPRCACCPVPRPPASSHPPKNPSNSRRRRVGRTPWRRACAEVRGVRH